MSRHETQLETKGEPRVTRTGALSRAVQERKRAMAAERLGLGWLVGKGRSSDAQGWAGVLICLAFALCATALVWWTRTQAIAPVGRIMTDTRLVRVESLELEDPEQTRAQRNRAREATPRVFVLQAGELEGLIQSIESLPQVVGGAKDLSEIDAGIVELFGLTPEMITPLNALRLEQSEELNPITVVRPDETPKPIRRPGSWSSCVGRLRDMLATRPMLESATYQRALQDGTSKFIRLIDPRDEGARPRLVLRGEMVSLGDSEALTQTARVLARDAGFPVSVREAVVLRLTKQTSPTYRFDEPASVRDQNEAATQVPVTTVSIPRRQVIVERGERLTPSQAQLLSEEQRAFVSSQPAWARLLSLGAMLGACLTITLGMAGYSILFAPRLRRKATRALGVAILMLLALGVASLGTIARPELAGVLSVLPTVFVVTLFCIGYERRTALAFGLLHGLLVCLALGEGVATFAIIATGVACVVATLKEVRDRRSLVRSSILSGVGLGLASIVFGLLERPLSRPAFEDLLVDAGMLGAGMLIVGGVTLFSLPLVERLFNVTTGLTLAELRDPKQPLLRELQVRAPGTYTHSLNVATIAEAAADAVGCDGLLAYVGALYHDVGKMNKPEYFVENQRAGLNKHDRLSPAMSLLVVVGHVKDGVELAREFRLPTRLMHFIEAHHGTTLVEYFYHRARRQALDEAGGVIKPGDEPQMPDEFEYRYPGPKPRTKEVAILMLADAIESAARALGEPTPAKIESLVQEIADKRLRDGQFDHCDLTLRELATISDSIARSVTSMYHARIAYPGGRSRVEPTSRTDNNLDGNAASASGVAGVPQADDSRAGSGSPVGAGTGTSAQPAQGS